MMLDVVQNAIADSNGALYVRAVETGYDLYDFIYKTLNSPVGDFVYSNDRLDLWQCDAYMLEWFEEELQFIPKRREYSSDPWSVGYFYRYFMMTRNLTGRQVYEIAPFNVIDSLYNSRLYITGWEYWIEELTDIHEGKLQITVDFE